MSSIYFEPEGSSSGRCKKEMYPTSRYNSFSEDEFSGSKHVEDI
jgi:hypothetical protein